VTGGGLEVLRIWDLENETLLQDFLTGTDHPISCIVNKKSTNKQANKQTNKQKNK